MKEIIDSDPTTLARMFELGHDGPQSLVADDTLRAMFAHQLSAKVAEEFDIASRPAPGDATAAAAGMTFRELFNASNPPSWLLEELKNFAKEIRGDADPTIQKIATALYYASVASALVRLKRRITELSNEQLAQGFRWGREQPWMDTSIAELFDRAATELTGHAT